MKSFLLALLVSVSAVAAQFTNLTATELKSKTLAQMMAQLSLLSDIEDTGVTAVKITANGKQTIDAIVRQNDRINGASDASAKVIVSKDAKSDAMSIAKDFLNALAREEDQDKRSVIQKKITAVFTKAFKTQKLVILAGGADFNGDAAFTAFTIVDTTTMEMIQIYTGYVD